MLLLIRGAVGSLDLGGSWDQIRWCCHLYSFTWPIFIECFNAWINNYTSWWKLNSKNSKNRKPCLVEDIGKMKRPLQYSILQAPKGAASWAMRAHVGLMGRCSPHFLKEVRPTGRSEGWEELSRGENGGLKSLLQEGTMAVRWLRRVNSSERLDYSVVETRQK